MTPDRQQTAELDITPGMKAEPGNNLYEKAQRALSNFFKLPLSENGHQHPENEIGEVVDRVWEIVKRNNLISDKLSSNKFQEVKERKRKLRGDTELGVVWCVDGRLDGMSMGVLVNIWEVPAGLIANEEVSNNQLIPSSPELAGHLKFDASQGKELLEIVFAHYDSIDPDHGCAANAAILATIKKNRPPENPGLLNFDDYSQINHTDRAEDANLIILSKTTSPAISHYFNRERQLADHQTLPQVTVVALYDTATMGVTLRNQGHEDLTTTNLTNKYQKIIAQTTGIAFGTFKETFTEAELFIDFSEKKIEIMEMLLTNTAGRQFFQDIDSYIRQTYPDLTKGQLQSLRFVLAESVAFQHLTGLSKLPDNGHPDHPFSKHSEGYMGISIRGEYIGKYDTKQAFGSTAADATDAIEQIKIEYGVMDKVGVDLNRPRIVFISNSISRHDYENDPKAVKRASSNNNGITRQIFKDLTIRNLVRTNRLVIFNVLIDDTTGAVLEVLDHSSSF